MPALHEPSDDVRKLVRSMAGFGLRQEDIAEAVGIDAKTLRKHYAQELAARHLATAKVAQSLFGKATGHGPGSVSAAIFWMKTQGRWSTKPAEGPPDQGKPPGADLDEPADITEAMSEEEAAENYAATLHHG